MWKLIVSSLNLASRSNLLKNDVDSTHSFYMEFSGKALFNGIYW
jgi:hypothetical protein